MKKRRKTCRSIYTYFLYTYVCISIYTYLYIIYNLLQGSSKQDCVSTIYSIKRDLNSVVLFVVKEMKYFSLMWTDIFYDSESRSNSDIKCIR